MLKTLLDSSEWRPGDLVIYSPPYQTEITSGPAIWILLRLSKKNVSEDLDSWYVMVLSLGPLVGKRSVGQIYDRVFPLPESYRFYHGFRIVTS